MINRLKEDSLAEAAEALVDIWENQMARTTITISRDPAPIKTIAVTEFTYTDSKPFTLD